jgi:O-antigen/teichoic acid export membrane protein
LPALLFAALFHPAAAGLYILTNRVLSMPMTIIGRAIGTYFFAHAADAHREKRMAQLVAGMHQRLAQIAMPPVLVFLLAGPELFAFVFGDAWREAGVFARWMAPWLYVTFVTSPLNALFDVVERQSLELLFEILLFTSRAVAITVGAFSGNLVLAIVLFSLAGVVSRGISLVWIVTNSGNSASVLVKPTLMALVWGGLCVSPLALGLLTFGRGNLWLLGLVVTGILIGGRFLYLFRNAD